MNGKRHIEIESRYAPYIDSSDKINREIISHKELGFVCHIPKDTMCQIITEDIDPNETTQVMYGEDENDIVVTPLLEFLEKHNKPSISKYYVE